MYIEKVEWVSVNAAANEVAKNASIDYKATGSYYKMTCLLYTSNPCFAG